MEQYIKIKVKKKKETLLKECGEVISLTCGDQGENHVGMDKVGNMVKEGEGFNLNDFKEYMIKFEKEGYVCELYNLNSYIFKKIINEFPNSDYVVSAKIKNRILN